MNKNILKLNSPLDAKKNDIGMDFQHFNLFETLSVFENLIIEENQATKGLVHLYFTKLDKPVKFNNIIFCKSPLEIIDPMPIIDKNNPNI